MRTLVLLLVLANLTLFAYTRLDSVGSGEGARLAQQVQPDKITLLTPQQVAALGPAKAASLADVCVEWGPLTDTDRARALADLEPLALGKLLSQKRVDVATGWWVYLPPAASKTAADNRATELRSIGIRDASVVDSGALRNAVALGAFRSEDAANAWVADLGRRGVNGARVGARAQTVAQTTLVIRDPPQPAIAKLREVAPGYPGVEVRIGSCDKAS